MWRESLAPGLRVGGCGAGAGLAALRQQARLRPPFCQEGPLSCFPQLHFCVAERGLIAQECDIFQWLDNLPVSAFWSVHQV